MHSAGGVELHIYSEYGGEEKIPCLDWELYFRHSVF